MSYSEIVVRDPNLQISDNLSKNAHVWATQWPTSTWLKTKFDPSLDRSWCELFKIRKGHGPKNPPKVYSWAEAYISIKSGNYSVMNSENL